jgi:ubiquinone/menaquinone biosynthesis C-methylase UbiE
MDRQSATGHLEMLRRFEIEAVEHFFTPNSKVLDIGGGTGYQASLIAEKGCKVLSIDLPNSGAAYTQFFPVQFYDGINLPGSPESFDLIFSSNVLEHVKNLPRLLQEMHRVLRRGCLAIHILPSSAWRFWTSVAFYAYLLKNLAGRGELVAGTDSATITLEQVGSAIRKKGFLRAAAKAVSIPFEGHGEFPNALAELYYFSRTSWIKQFRATGFSVENVYSNGIFYTGHSVFPHLSYDKRKRMSRFLGSAGNIFVLRKR